MSRKTIPRETEKPKKLTRAQKKEIDAVLRKYKGDGKPRTAQATIPYEAIYPDGVCRIDRRTFSKCIAFEDISYQLAQPETRTAIFEHLCDLYNYVDASIHVQLSFLNRKVDPVQYAKSFEIAPQGDDFDDIRAEYTAILQKQLASGNNGIVKTKYLTFTIEADSLKTARARLARIGLDLLGYFKTMGCVAHVMDGQERLEVSVYIKLLLYLVIPRLSRTSLCFASITLLSSSVIWSYPKRCIILCATKNASSLVGVCPYFSACSSTFSTDTTISPSISSPVSGLK